MLSILSYNILFGKRLPQVIDWISKRPKQFDIICFQEFPFSQIASLANSPLATFFEYHTALGFKHAGQEYGQLTLINRKKIKVISAETIYLGTNFWESKVFGFTGGRSALATKCHYNGIDFTLVNTHLVAFGSNSHRRAQMAKIIDHFDNHAEKNHPIVVLGDLNYSSLTGRGSLIRLMQEHKFTNAHTLNTHRLLNIKDHQLDYIFYKNMQVGDINVLKLPFSDHLPITFTLLLK
jgi:endonuclease/exonuclease/phosphatase family metal-dependent hydrolase